MNNTETIIPRPYTDWSELKKLGSELDSREAQVTARFCSFFELTAEFDRQYNAGKDPAPYYDLSETKLLTASEVRQLISVRLTEEMEKKFNRAGVKVRNITGMNNTMLSKILCSVRNAEPVTVRTLANGDQRLVIPKEIRTFTAPDEVIPGLADTIFNSSSHKMMFGEECPIYLPNIHSMAAAALRTAGPDKKNRILQRCSELKKQVIDQYCAEHDLALPPNFVTAFSAFRPSYEILRERLTELSWEVPTMNSRRFIFFNGNDGPMKMRLSQFGTMTGKAPGADNSNWNAKKDKSHQYSCSLEYPIFWTIETDADPYLSTKSFDFFHSNDYIRVDGGVSEKPLERPQEIYYRAEKLNRDGDKLFHPESYELLTDQDTLRILSYCVALPGSMESEILGLCFS